MKTEKKKWQRYNTDFKYKVVKEKLDGDSYRIKETKDWLSN